MLTRTTAIMAAIIRLKRGKMAMMSEIMNFRRDSKESDWFLDPFWSGVLKHWGGMCFRREPHPNVFYLWNINPMLYLTGDVVFHLNVVNFIVTISNTASSVKNFLFDLDFGYPDISEQHIPRLCITSTMNRSIWTALNYI